jgi:serine/threonine protein kinase
MIKIMFNIVAFSGLACLHESFFLHRDIKPANLLIGVLRQPLPCPSLICPRFTPSSPPQNIFPPLLISISSGPDGVLKLGQHFRSSAPLPIQCAHFPIAHPSNLLVSRRFRLVPHIRLPLKLPYDSRSCHSLVRISHFSLQLLFIESIRYRAPELLFCSKIYTPAIDVWSAGCIMAEMFTGMPLFDGGSEIDQISKITLTLGNIDVKRWPGDFIKRPDAHLRSFAERRGR